MYKHHEESLERLKEYFAGREEVTAVIFGGSVAKGCERPDSDLDAMIVVTDEAYRRRVESGATAETIHGY
ncbi:MAG: nucleotidyltransferase domain-containing protein, partial [Lachnospiraceae bacterium]|nr:nucleotidyltransferase domain-containing protein [Lachnospiraceae bacterium]